MKIKNLNWWEISKNNHYLERCVKSDYNYAVNNDYYKVGHNIAMSTSAQQFKKLFVRHIVNPPRDSKFISIYSVFGS